jgi:formylglycine-generating enzyme required for sulfatase activity
MESREMSKPTDTVQWVHILEGEFLMGSDPARDRRCWGNEQPQHLVFLKGFDITRSPVTNLQYKRFVDATGHRKPKHWVDDEIPKGMEHHPVVEVDWFDAKSFCEWVDGRLPTEAEWEKAARGTDGRIYPWGDDRPRKNLCTHNFFTDGTLPVDSHPQGESPYGLQQMAGNVWEWTGTKPGDYPYDPNDGREEQDDSPYRVLRGGAFRTVNRPRCAFRDLGTPPTQSTCFRGFRVARSESP